MVADDQKLYEDETVDRMEEAMTLFESVANSRHVSSAFCTLEMC